MAVSQYSAPLVHIPQRTKLVKMLGCLPTILLVGWYWPIPIYSKPEACVLKNCKGEKTPFMNTIVIPLLVRVDVGRICTDNMTRTLDPPNPVDHQNL